MKWQGREESTNVEDRRGIGTKVGLAAGGGGLALILALVLAWVFGADPQKVMQLIGQVQQAQQGAGTGQGQGEAPPRPVDPVEEQQASFTKIIFRDAEIIWEDLFRQMKKPYRKPTLVLFSGEVKSACGLAGAAVGPFYCPGDDRVYIDLS